MAAIELFEFLLTGAYYRYTSGSETITKDAADFTPAAIRRETLPLSDDFSRAGLTITVLYDNPFVVAALPAPQPATVTVFGELEEGTWATIWKGRMVGLSMKSMEAEIQTENLLSAMARMGNTSKYQLNCRHVLYGAGCNANPVTYKFAGTVDGIDDATLTVTGLNGEDDGYYTGGYVKIGAYIYRSIVDHTGDDIELFSAIPGLALTTAIDVFPGCDHAKTTCQSKFGNLLNFGGFPYLPIANNPFNVVRPRKVRR